MTALVRALGSFLALVLVCLGVTVVQAQPRKAPISQNADYIIGPRDVLAVTVVNEPTLSGRFTVVADGTVTYPLLGPVKVGGLSPTAVEHVLTDKLADGYLEKPIVSVALEQFASQRVLVVGEVRQAGSYPLAPKTTVLEALLQAGAPTQNAGTEALVVRAGGKTPSATQPPDASASNVVKVNLDALQHGDLTQNVLLEPGDMVFVPRAEPQPPVYVTGQVNRPGAYQVTKGTTVLQALAEAGGITDRASTGRITIVRLVQGKHVEVKASLQDLVQPGDTIVVRRRFF
jgi:polysaccharide export outer membrane protein